MRRLPTLLLLLNMFTIAACVNEGVSSKRSASSDASKTGGSKRSGGIGDLADIGDETTMDTNGLSVITGKVTAADGSTPLAGAKVYMLKGGSKVSLKNAVENTNSDQINKEEECVSDSQGRFACAGLEDDTDKYSDNNRKKFIIEKPKIVQKEFEADVAENTVTPINTEKTRLQRSEVATKWLVVPGQYDGVQLLLSQLKGCRLTGDERFSSRLRKSLDCESAGLSVLNDDEINIKFNSLANLTPYHFIFINCPTNMSAYSDVIVQYVRNGGHIYFSDWAASGLESAFPGKVQFGAKNTDGGSVGASVLNNGLKSYLGRSNIPIYFDYSAWVPVESVSDNVRTYLRGNTSLLGGKTDAAITVGWREEGKGNVFFTSYHIEGASTGANQERSLKYLLLNINDICLY